LAFSKLRMRKILDTTVLRGAATLVSGFGCVDRGEL
jgi:hypothetical protein